MREPGKRTRSIGAAFGVACLALTIPSAAHAAGPKTTITFTVTNCEGCVFKAHNGHFLSKAWKVAAKSSPVTNGNSTMTVPRSSTKWLSFEVVSPDGYMADNAVPFVRMRDGDRNPLCWGQSPGRKARLDFTAKTYQDKNMAGELETFIEVWRNSVASQTGTGVNGTPGCPRSKQ